MTKANLFFARGLIVMEGDGAAILVPTLARLIGRNLTEHGVSIVNVGGTGLRRYARILQRQDPAKGVFAIPTACLADMDVMPDCAPRILELVVDDADPKWTSPRRKWRGKREFGATPADQKVGRRAAPASSASTRFTRATWTAPRSVGGRRPAEEQELA